MSFDFDSYDNLQAVVAKFLQRNNLGDEIPLFIKMAEDKLKNVLLKFPQQFAQPYSIVPSAGTTFIALPSDCSLISKLEYKGKQMKFIPPEQASSTSNTFESGNYTLVDNGILLQTAVDGQSTLTIYYYSKLQNLSDFNESNWLLEDYPTIYLYATLMEAALYMMDDDAAQKWNMALQGAVSDAVTSIHKARIPRGSMLRRRLV
ncbi:hypothetical protein AWB76_00943 [Caballeronia temeraria]|uniref:Uncharacterized protein n=1 Tax=Caballeronia temeraria TaxID=1777137 RepID=A0A157ZM73_9BURK|nr:hypothetical protein [Caballeronia temeraria]SAK46608.1 hypothetical protein AWB76_00943 [Caballeronia temeraria]